jgi:hypothetical protein
MLPIIPKIMPTSGWYTSIRNTFSLAALFKKKWFVSHPRIVSTEPEMVAILKMMNYG